MVKQLNLVLDEEQHKKLSSLKRKTGLTWVQFFMWLAEMERVQGELNKDNNKKVVETFEASKEVRE